MQQNGMVGTEAYKNKITVRILCSRNSILVTVTGGRHFPHPSNYQTFCFVCWKSKLERESFEAEVGVMK